MRLSYAAYELAVDRLLSRSCRNTRSIFDLPPRKVLDAYHQGVSPEELAATLESSEKSPDANLSGQSSLF
jgi:hypothetical protein